MHILNFFNMPKLKIFLILLLSLTLNSSCGIYKPVDARKTPEKGIDKARKNIEEGKGVSIRGMMGGGKTNTFQFSTSNPMWRSSIEILDFLPLTTVDYSGGLIISDWYTDSSNSNDSLKITVRFLSNEISATSLKIIVHQRTCNNLNQCLTQKIDSKIEDELRSSILKKAAMLEKEDKNKKKK